MKILRDWLEAYRDRTAVLRDAAMLIADALDARPADGALARERVGEQRTDSLPDDRLTFDSWFAENYDVLGEPEAVNWARSVMQGNEPDSGAKRAEAEMVLVDALLPRALWVEDEMAAQSG